LEKGLIDNKRKHNATYTLNATDKQKKTALANNKNYTLVWYAYYDLWPGNGADPFLTARSPHGAQSED